jgi:hypothetical protein
VEAVQIKPVAINLDLDRRSRTPTETNGAPVASSYLRNWTFLSGERDEVPYAIYGILIERGSIAVSID